VRIGLVSTIRDEEAFIAHNLEYHRFVGVDQFYVFLDQSRDGSRQLLEKCADVTLRNTQDKADAERIFPAAEAIEKALLRVPYASKALAIPARHVRQRMIDQFDLRVGFRQVLNLHMAIDEARRDGCDWLIHLDADELVAPNLTQTKPGAIKDFFSALDAEVETVIFLPLEVIQKRLRYESFIFAEETFFRTAFTQDGKRYGLVPQLPRQILDPLTNELVEQSGYVGHRLGKSALRLSAAADVCTVHFFLSSTRPLRFHFHLGLLHYNIGGFADFLKKYTAFAGKPSDFPLGMPRPRVQNLWRDLVNCGQLSRQQLRDYYERWIVYSEEELAEMQAMTPSPLREVTVVRDTFHELGPY